MKAFHPSDGRLLVNPEQPIHSGALRAWRAQCSQAENRVFEASYSDAERAPVCRAVYESMIDLLKHRPWPFRRVNEAQRLLLRLAAQLEKTGQFEAQLDLTAAFDDCPNLHYSLQ